MSTSDQCAICKHHLGLQQCKAFPMRIPQRIYSGEHDHREPFQGDNGIRWEPLEGMTEEELGLD